LWAYNTYQSTGFIDVTTKTNSNPFSFVTAIPGEAVARKVVNHWNISMFRDYHNNTGPLNSSAWADISQDYFIDKIPVNTDLTTSQFEIARLKDYFLICRLYFEQPENYKLNTEIMGISFSYTDR